RGALDAENVIAVRAGMDNLGKHVENVRQFGLSPVVALNHFVGDTDAEVAAVIDACAALDVPARVARVWERGGEGGIDLGRAVRDLLARRDPARFRFLSPEDMPLPRKLEPLAPALYGADGVNLLPAAAARLARLEALGYGKLPVCVAKTQNS